MLHQTSYGLQNCSNHSIVMLKIIEFNYFKRTLGTIVPRTLLNTCLAFITNKQMLQTLCIPT